MGVMHSKHDHESSQDSMKGKIRTRSGQVAAGKKGWGLTYNKHKHDLPGLTPPYDILGEKKGEQASKKRKIQTTEVNILNNK